MSRALLLLALAVGLASCEVPFDPVAPSDRAFSMSGYLDASADTQWVRVEPVTPTLAVPEGPLDAEVALVGPSGTTPLAPVVRTFATGPAHLFWTTTPVRPATTYRLVVTGADGRTSRTDVAIPDTAGVEVIVQDGPFACPAAIVVVGAERVVDVIALYGLPPEDGVRRYRRISKRASLEGRPAGGVRAFIYFGDDAPRFGASPLPGRSDVTTEAIAAIGTDAWPEIDGLTLETALLAAATDRVEGGVGFVGGVVTYRVPFTPGLGRNPPPNSTDPPVPCATNSF